MAKRYIVLCLVLAIAALATAGLFTDRATTSRAAPSQTVQQIPTVKQKGASTVVQSQSTSGVHEVTPQALQSLQEARASYGYPLLLPSAVPTGFHLQSIQHYHLGPGSDFLNIRYATAEGHYLLVQQGAGPIGVQGIVKYVPNTYKGTVTVQGRSAEWIRGKARLKGPAGNASNIVWQPGSPLKLSWATGTAAIPSSPSSVSLNYVLESDALTLDQLVAIGNSVQP